ncbi:hypothetical protein EYF80_027934 [Liparis tanakae]|uniref:Uncharacterized protein n=1 Tax=Liparis tanakae TaxID=230148 RepID=A0A4Z2H7C3_9TELE|nr:hypothetical protein EYF80_027934 [Liparis tanakae]
MSSSASVHTSQQGEAKRQSPASRRRLSLAPRPASFTSPLTSSFSVSSTTLDWGTEIWNTRDTGRV